jgi:hypothetical protein
MFQFLFPHIYRRIQTLEYHMARLDDALAELNDATNAVAARLEDVLGDIEQADSAAADKVRVEVERLRSLAADPQNPVPPEPQV